MDEQGEVARSADRAREDTLPSRASVATKPGSAAARLVLGLYFVALLVLLIAVVASEVKDTPVVKYTGDPAAVLDGPVFTGFVSNFGLILWSAAAGVALLGTLTFPIQRTDRRAKLFLIACALVSLWLALDDAFQLHEIVAPDMGISQRLVLLIYLVAFVGFAAVFRDFIWKHRWTFMAAGIFFAISIVVDVADDKGWIHEQILLEEAAKLLGIASWLGFVVLATVDIAKGNQARSDTPVGPNRPSPSGRH